MAFGLLKHVKRPVQIPLNLFKTSLYQAITILPIRQRRLFA